MASKKPPSHQAADRNFLRILAGYTQWDAGLVEALFFETGVYPDKKGWRHFLDRFLLATGAVLMLTGIIFFFAYNWSEMSKFAKMGIVEVLILGVAFWAWLKPPERFSHKIALTALSVLVGALIAVFGQIYQTGANAYDFFLGWTLFVTIWVGISRFPPLWYFYLVLVNTTLILFGVQVFRLWDEPYAIWAIIALNLGAWAGFEYLGEIKKVDFPSRWLPRLTGLGALVFLTGLSTFSAAELAEDKADLPGMLTLGGAVLIWAFCLWLYRNKIQDLFFLALVPISALIVGITWLAILLDDPWEFTLFLCGGIVIGVTTGMVRWLMQISRSWQSETPSSNTEKHA